MNRVVLMGRLTRDPETRYSQGSEPIPITRYTLAVDRRGRKNQDGANAETQADFINIVVFRAGAEFASKYFVKGMRVCVEGRIQTGSYINKEGQKVYTTDVIADNQEFADSKNANAGQAPAQAAAQPTSAPAGNNYGGGYGGTGFSDIGDGFMNIPEGIEDEGLPFN